MPCLSYGYESDRDSYDSEKERLRKDKANLEAALCTALTFIEKTGRVNNYIAATDWKEAGVTPEQVQSWWESHKEKDRIRREKEQAVKDKQAAIALRVKTLQAKSWAELTKAELKFLSTHAKK